MAAPTTALRIVEGSSMDKTKASSAALFFLRSSASSARAR